MITPSHLRYSHGITLDDYREMFPGAELVSAEVRQQMSESREGHVVSEETRRLIAARETGKEVSEKTRQLLSVAGIGNTHALGHRLSPEKRQQISENETGKVITEDVRRRTSKTLTGHEVSEKTRKLIADSLVGHEVTKVTRQKKSDSMKERWKDAEFAKSMAEAWNRKPSRPELQLLSVLDKHFRGEWEYVGDGKVWIEGRNPDFLNVNSKKLVIEMFGMFWHNPEFFPNRLSEEELTAHYKKYGITCLVIWEYDIFDEDEVVRRVMEASR